MLTHRTVLFGLKERHNDKLLQLKNTRLLEHMATIVQRSRHVPPKSPEGSQELRRTNDVRPSTPSDRNTGAFWNLTDLTFHS